MNRPSIARTVLTFQLDEAGDWVVALACGHTRHVRHQPPWLNRPWVITEAMRGQKMRCGWCEQAGSEEQEADAP